MPIQPEERYIGIEDDGTVVGVNDIDSAQLQLINAVNDTVKPDITSFITYKTENVNDKNIIVIEVQKGTAAPYYIASKGIIPEGVFVRQGPHLPYRQHQLLYFK